MILGVILAGGRASRLGGGDKGLRVVAGRPILERIIERLSPQVDRVLLNANGEPARFAMFGIEVIADTVPDLPGPLAGILAGLERAADLGAGSILTVPCDAPFAPRDLRVRLSAAGPFALAVGGDGRRHPTFGLWPVRMRARLRAGIADGARRVGAWMAEHGAAEAHVGDEAAFFNLNDETDLARAQEIAARHG